MDASAGSDVVWSLPAVPGSVGLSRRRAVAFASAAGGDPDVAAAVALAVSETVTNAVVHAYVGREAGTVTVRCRTDGDAVIVEVADAGVGISARVDSPGIGHGLATVGALAQAMDVTNAPGGGTVVTMSFARARREDAIPGLDALCTLALEHVADVSCLDVVHDGVLRRAAAQVAGDEALTAWLRSAAPPARPGTATWTALQEGAPRLLVHDPAVPRSPGGTGERLQLTWWIALPLRRAPDARPTALWGLGGREDGRAVPTDATLRVLVEAAGTDLAVEGPRAALRARLALT